MAGGLQPPVIVDLMARALANPDLLSLAAGFTDNAVLPYELVGQHATELANASAVQAGDVALQYGQNQGRTRLRELTAAFLESHPNERPGVFNAEQMMISNGSQQSLYIAAQCLCDPGDIILVEQPSYFVCLEMLQGLGIEVLGMPCDAAGAVELDALPAFLESLTAAGKRERLKAVYLVSYFGNPSSRSLSLEEKRGLAHCLSAADCVVPVLEDAAYRELYYAGPHPVPSVFSLPEFDRFPKLYLGTYTKPFATGLKVGFCHCSDALLLEKMLCVKGHQDFGTAHFNQSIIERVLDSGEYAQHLAEIQAHYAQKAEVMATGLRAGGLAELGWKWSQPQGGLIFWLRAPVGLDLSMDGDFCKTCIERGVLYVPGDLCFPEGGPRNCVRLSTGALPAERLLEAVGRFCAVAQHFAQSA